MRPLTRFQPLAGTADFENLIFLGEGAEDTGKPADLNEAALTATESVVQPAERLGHLPDHLHVRHAHRS
jgi:hypothetical protein